MKSSKTRFFLYALRYAAMLRGSVELSFSDTLYRPHVSWNQSTLSLNNLLGFLLMWTSESFVGIAQRPGLLSMLIIPGP